jgi:hypothetical protein
MPPLKFTTKRDPQNLTGDEKRPAKEHPQDSTQKKILVLD